MRNIYAISVLIFVLTLAACGTTGKVLKSTYCTSVYGCAGKYEIKDPSQRIENLCLSVLPPQEQGWSIVRKQGWWIKGCNAIIIGTEDMSTLETTIIAIVPFKLDEIKTTEDYFVQMKEKYDDLPEIERQKVIEFEQDIYQVEDNSCTIHSYLVKDTGMPEKYKKSVMYLESIDINCPIPWKALFSGDMGVRFSYSRRYNPGDDDPEFKEKVLEFFDQVQFLE